LQGLQPKGKAVKVDFVFLLTLALVLIGMIIGGIVVYKVIVPTNALG